MKQSDDGVKYGRLKTRLLNLADWSWDARLGIRTFGYFPASGVEGSDSWYLHYTPSAYADIFRGLRAAKIESSDVFVDIGSGMGRAVFAASYMGARQATGIERVAGLHTAAMRNRARTSLDRERIEFQNIDAMDADLADATILFLFHPFGAPLLETFIGALRRQREAARAKLPVRIVYYNPVYDSVLRDAGWLQKIELLAHRPSRLASAARYETAVWTSVTD